MYEVDQLGAVTMKLGTGSSMGNVHKLVKQWNSIMQGAGVSTEASVVRTPHTAHRTPRLDSLVACQSKYYEYSSTRTGIYILQYEICMHQN